MLEMYDEDNGKDDRSEGETSNRAEDTYDDSGKGLNTPDAQDDHENHEDLNRIDDHEDSGNRYERNDRDHSNFRAEPDGLEDPHEKKDLDGGMGLDDSIDHTDSVPLQPYAGQNRTKSEHVDGERACQLLFDCDEQRATGSLYCLPHSEAILNLADKLMENGGLLLFDIQFRDLDTMTALSRRDFLRMCNFPVHRAKKVLIVDFEFPCSFKGVSLIPCEATAF